MQNTPDVKMAVVGVSRDCFPIELTGRRLDKLVAASESKVSEIYRCSIVVENEVDAAKANQEITEAGCNALVIYLGNFGPENPIAKLAQDFSGPVMLISAAEESKSTIGTDRGDALCGLMNASMACGLRQMMKPYIPQRPCGLPEELAECISDFEAIARVVIGVKNLKLIGFGPRPHDFLACNAPIQPLFNMGVEVMENSELDLFSLYKEAGSQTERIAEVAADMKAELGEGCTYPDLLPKLAQFEIALLDFMEANKGTSEYVAFADKCWPAFEFEFGFTPCYVNSRLAGRGIPVACEVDLYGALSEYMVQCATLQPATLLDINNSVPSDMLEGTGMKTEDLHMGFHCGNTCTECMADCKLNYQVIMNRLMEDGGTPDITRGTLEGMIKPGDTTLFRLQSSGDAKLKSYIAEGEFADLNPETFGSTGVVHIPGFYRFYRHVLVGKQFPHHGAYSRGKVGKILFAATQMLGISDISVPLPEGQLYAGENPFEA
ncbi:L-fucose/L-arabinose isomerase family protein [Pontiella sp.]|uniref:L-fucose/L-arabinose isomerase family protein n=1 Tax=Pontiella sp. TaxID=2837462 RepID=UPI003566D46A